MAISILLPLHSSRLAALAASSLLLVALGCGPRSDPALLGPASGTRPSAQDSLPAGLPSSAPPTEGPPITVREAPPGQAPLVGPPVRVDGAPPGVQTAETSIVASPDGELLAAWGDTRSAEDGSIWRIGYAVSFDDGDTWHEDLLTSPATAGLVDFEADPMTAWDPRTGNFWAGGISFTDPPEIFVARKQPNSLTFEPAVRIRADEPRADKGFLTAGTDPEDPAATLLHFIGRRGLHTSHDLGATWSDLLFQGNLQGPVPRVGPGGELYVAFWNGLDGVQLLRSFDGGTTLEERTFIARRNDRWDNLDGSRFPGRFRVPPLPYLAVDSVDGNLYCVYFDTVRVVEGEADVDLLFTRSEDRGDTWTPARPIPFGARDPDRPWTGDQFFPWIEIDALGRLHLVFYDTRHVEQQDDQPSAHLDVYYAWSEDRGESWSELRLTEEPFETGDVQWTVPEGQFLGDYLGLAATLERAHPLYAVARDGDLDLWTRRIDFLSPEAPADPQPPQGLTAAPEGTATIRVGWQPTGPGTSVVIELRDLFAESERRLTAPLGATGWVFERLGAGHPYAIRLATRTAAGVSAWSDEVFVTPLAPRRLQAPRDEEP